MEGQTEIKQTQNFKKGDILYTSWGYDQTNYDFIIIESISPTGKTALCRRVKIETVGTTEQADIQKPTNESFGELFRLKIDRESLRGNYPFLNTGEGSKRFDFFRIVTPNSIFYETNSMFGH